MRSWAHAGLLAGAPLACLLEQNPAFDGASSGSTSTAAESSGPTTGGSDVDTSAATSTTAGESTTTATTAESSGPPNDSSSSETGDPMASCGDGRVAIGERCHVGLPAVMVGVAARRIAAADLDGDALPDVAVVGQDPLVPLLFGIGDGMLAMPEVVELSQGELYDVEIADLDVDGELDLAIASAPNGSIIAVLGPLAGAIGTEIVNGGMGSPRALGLGQFADTNALDVLYANNGANVRIAVGDGTGAFVYGGLSVPAGDDNAQGLVVGELDEDPGWLDAVSLQVGTNKSTTVLHGGVGGPTMGEMHGALGGAMDLALADLDGDGIAEIVVANRSDNSLTIAELGGVEERLMVDGKPVAVASADFDLDGHADLAIVHQSDTGDHLALRYGDGTLAPTEADDFSVGETPVALVIADFDADSVPDVAVAAAGSEDLHVVASAP